MTGKQKILIKNGLIYDHAQNLNGEKSDIYVSDGKISKPFFGPDITIDADKKTVFAGGIDPFFQLASPGLNFLRLNDKLPSLESIGTNYAKCGYTHIHQPLTTLLTAGLTWHKLDQVPYLDKSCRLTPDLRDIGRFIKANNIKEFISQSKVLLKMAGAIGLFFPFPYLKHKQRHYMHMNISLKKALEFLSGLQELPPARINILGNPGIFDTEIPNPEKFHISNIGQALSSQDDIQKAVEFLDAGGSADIRLNDGNEALEIKPDVPQIQGSLSFDTGLNHPIRFSFDKTPITDETSGLAWKLMTYNKLKWRISLSTHSYYNRPLSLAASWLFDNGSRPDIIKNILGDYKMDVYEYARITRFEPARSLGFTDFGALKIGSSASIAIYDFNKNTNSQHICEALGACRALLKNGEIIINNGEFTENKPNGASIIPGIKTNIASFAKSDSLQRPTLRWENLALNFNKK